MDRAAGFPGTLYDADGRSLDPTMPDLEQDQVDACPHRSMVTDRDMAPVACVWLLANDAAPGAIASAIMAEAVQLVLAGKGVLILAQRPEPEVDVRTALLQALDLATAPYEAAGHT